MAKFLILFLPFAVIPFTFNPQTSQQSQSEKMTIDKLDKIIRDVGKDVQQGPNIWQFTVNELQMACVVDTNFDRMRIIAPVIETAKLTDGQKDKMLEANFHTALDVRYGTNNGFVFSAFIHPLSPLQEKEAHSAIRQVFTLAATFGKEYTSGELIYGGQQNQK